MLAIILHKCDFGLRALVGALRSTDRANRKNLSAQSSQPTKHGAIPGAEAILVKRVDKYALVRDWKGTKKAPVSSRRQRSSAKQGIYAAILRTAGQYD